MIGWLAVIFDGIAALATTIAAAVVSVIDLGLVAFAAAVAAAYALLPSMSDAPAIGDPTWLHWLNWFFPVGAFVTGLSLLVVMWISFLAVRYILRLTRAL